MKTGRSLKNSPQKFSKSWPPKARVERNAKLSGKRSGVERQIDILIEEAIAQYKIRVVIDCKDYQILVDVKANVRVVEKLFFGQFRIESTRGFTDEATGDFLTSSLTTAHLDIHQAEKDWKQIDSIKQLAVKPALVLHVKSMIGLG